MIAIDHRCHFSYCASARLALREEECQQDRGCCRVVTRLTTIAPKRKNKMQNTEIQACKIQKCNLANTKIQARKKGIQTIWNKQLLHKDKRLKVSARQSVLQGGHQGHHELHQSAKTKCEIQKYKPLKYRNTDNLKSVNITRKEKLNFIAERYKPCNYVTLIYHLNKICRLWIIANE